MEFRSPLSQRIILAFVLLTGVVSGLFALGLSATIHHVEATLVSTELQKDFSRVFADYKKGQDLRLDDGSAFFAAGPNLPDYLRSVPTGHTEIVLDDHAYFVYHVKEGKTSYFLVKDQTAFEKEEIILQRAVFGGFLLSLVISFVLGLFMVKQVIAPVRRLTRQVVDQQDLRDAPPVFSDYADDEVGALARAFENTIAKRQQALQRETFFTSDVSHELRTPLMVIHSSCDVLMARKELDDYTRQRIGTIRRAAHEMKGLVEAFLALARGQERQAEKATLEAIVREEFPVWEKLAAEKGNTLLLRKSPRNPPPGERAYPAVLLRTVLANLIRNAIHHTTAGEILVVEKVDGFDIRDTGSGIATEEKSQVFKPYYRGSASHREGLGLGLSLVQRICEREGWTVVLEENRPNGCCFSVRLG